MTSDFIEVHSAFADVGSDCREATSDCCGVHRLVLAVRVPLAAVHAPLAVVRARLTAVHVPLAVVRARLPDSMWKKSAKREQLTDVREPPSDVRDV